MASLSSKAKTRIAAARLRSALGDRYASKMGTVAGTVAGRNLAMVNGRLVRADGLDDLPDGSPVTLSNIGTPGMALYAPEGGALAVQYVAGSGGSGGGGVSDHGLLSGLGDDDHPQYLTSGRGDALYVPIGRQVNTPASGGLQGGGALTAALSLSLQPTVAGSGLNYSAGVLSVGAGTMITVGATAVGLSNGTAQYQVPVTGAPPYVPTYTALSSFAGNGLVFSGGVFAVGQGDGITVNPTNVALTTPGGLSVSTTNSASGSHTHAVTASAAPGATSALLKTDATGLLTLQQLKIGAATTLYATNDASVGPDIGFASAGLIAAEASLTLVIDSTNTTTTGALVIRKDAPTTAGVELARVDESGMLSVLTSVRVTSSGMSSKPRVVTTVALGRRASASGLPMSSTKTAV